MDILQLLLVPFLLALVLTGIHAYLGLHVLARRVVFVDLALAQIAALGATVAFMLGHAPNTLSAYGYSLGFTLAGAVLLSFSRLWTGGRISQEAIVGVIYVVSAAAAVLLVDQAPQGAEHLKQILTGSILTATPADLLRLCVLYAVIGLLHWRFRKPLLAISFGSGRATSRLWWWDLLFYALFGVVVTSSVAVAGVLLVFSFLIIPAAIGMLYSKQLTVMLLLGWAAGALASLLGLSASYFWDFPTGAAMVCAFGAVLAAAGAVKPFWHARRARRHQVWKTLRFYSARGVLVLVGLSALWLVVRPSADQPLFDLAEYAIPALRTPFLTASEREQQSSSREAEEQARNQAQRLNDKERTSRWQGKAMSDDEVRRLSSFTQSYHEMRKGEQVVQRELRDRARARQRWVLGVPLLLFVIAGWLWLGRASSRTVVRTGRA
jgi:zinc/manganese transport system permease protein